MFESVGGEFQATSYKILDQAFNFYVFKNEVQGQSQQIPTLKIWQKNPLRSKLQKCSGKSYSVENIPRVILNKATTSPLQLLLRCLHVA